MNERASVDRLSRRVLSEKFDRMGFGTGFEWVTFLSLLFNFCLDTCSLLLRGGIPDAYLKLDITSVFVESYY